MVPHFSPRPEHSSMSANAAGAGAGDDDDELPLSHTSSDDLEVYTGNSGERDGGEDGLVEVRVGGGSMLEAGPARAVDGDRVLEYEVDCPVCWAPWTEDGPHQPCSLACGHTFGRMCLEKWICKWKKNTCPKCKRHCDLDDIRPIYPPRVAAICKNALKDSKLSSLQITEYMELMQAIEDAVKMVEGQSQNLEEFKSQQENKWAALVEEQAKIMQEIDDIKMNQTRIVQTLLWELQYVLCHGGLPIASSSKHAFGGPATFSSDLDEVPIYALRNSASVSADIDEDTVHVLNVSDSASAEMDHVSIHALGDSASVCADIDEVPIHALKNSSSASAKMDEVFVHAFGDSSSVSANTDEVPVHSIGDSTSDSANMDEEPIHALGDPASDSADMDDVPPTHPSDAVL